VNKYEQGEQGRSGGERTAHRGRQRRPGRAAGRKGAERPRLRHHARLGELLERWSAGFAQASRLGEQRGGCAEQLTAADGQAQREQQALTRLVADSERAERLKADADAAWRQAETAASAALDGGSLAEWREQWRQTVQQGETLRRLTTLAADLQALEQQQAARQAQGAALAAERAQADALVRGLRGDYRQAQEQVADKRRLLEQEQRIRSLEQHRAALQPGEACPLCGAREHPALAAYQALDLDASAEALRLKETALEMLREQGQQAAAQLAGLEARLRQLDEQEQQQRARGDELREQWLSLGAPWALAAGDWNGARLEGACRDTEQERQRQEGGLRAAEQAEAAREQARQQAQRQGEAAQLAHQRQALQRQSLDTEEQRRQALRDELLRREAEQREQADALAADIAAAGFLAPEPAHWLVSVMGM
jgi:exonuclease SbcC